MSNQELIEKTDEAISELVYDKYELLKAYNYYNGIRDPEQFKYLEENFGIGSPTSIEFTPLLKKHVDALIGEYLGTPILPKISCKDSETISNISREKQLLITLEVIKFLQNHLSNSILLNISGGTDKAIKSQLDKIIQDIDLSFVSLFEMAALNIILYIMQSRETDLVTKLRLLLTDLLISGYTFFRVKPTSSGTNIEIEVLNPLNTFIDRNPESPYVKNSYRAVVRYWMTKSLILARYGKDLKKSDIEGIKDSWNESAKYISAHTPSIISNDSYNSLPGYPSNDHSYRRHDLIPVYDVEWLETDKDFVMKRYNTIRIGDRIYILKGEDKTAIRSKDNPNFCSLSVNGVFFLNGGLNPYSLILECAHLLDRYDLLIYYRDKLIANSGTHGLIIDMPLIPAELGVNWPERVLKWLAYRKQGTLLINTSLEGRNNDGASPINTIFNGYDDTLPALAVQAIELAIQSVEQTTSSITGVFRERLNGIELRDAVSNIKLGVTNSFIVTKHYFLQMDLIVCEMLLASLNQAKITYKKGLTGTIILGDKYLKIFTAFPEHFTITDYDVHVTASTEVMEDMQTLKSILPEFIKSQSLTPDIIFEALTSKSLTDLKYKVSKAMRMQKEENNLLLLLLQQLEQTNQQAQQLLQELKQATNKILLLDEARIKLEQEKIQLTYKVDLYKAKTDDKYKERKMDVEEKRTMIEIAQLRDGNPYNDKIRELE